MSDIPGRPVLAAHVRRQLDRQTGSPMLLHPEGAIELSETADAIVRLCDGSRSPSAIISALAAHYEAPEDTIRRDVESCLRALAAAGVIGSA